MKLAALGRLLSFVGALIMFAIASTADASMFYTEPFNYADGNLVNGTNGPNAPSPPFWLTHSGTGTPVQVSSGTISTTSGATSRQDVNLPTGSALAQGQTWYAGFDLTLNGPFTLTGTSEEYFAHFYQTVGGGFTGRVYVSAPQSGGDFTVGVVGASNTPSVKWGSDLALGQTYRVVVSYTLDPDNDPLTEDSYAKLWIDPINESSTSILSVANHSNAVDAFAFRQGSTAGSGTQVIDNLCVATTFTEALTCVPEPASVGLFMVAGLALMFIRKRAS